MASILSNSRLEKPQIVIESHNLVFLVIFVNGKRISHHWRNLDELGQHVDKLDGTSDRLVVLHHQEDERELQ